MIAHRRSLFWGCLAAVVLISCGGCAEQGIELPKTHPVEGTVYRADGKPFPGGDIQFFSSDKAHSDLSVFAQIADDGKFTLITIGSNGQAPGAPEGTYSVVVGSRDFANPEQPKITDTFTVKPGKNQFTIKVPAK